MKYSVTEMFKTMDLDEEMKERNVPEWLKSDRKNGSGDVISKPETDDTEIGIQTRLIIEYYSRR